MHPHSKAQAQELRSLFWDLPAQIQKHGASGLRLCLDETQVQGKGQKLDLRKISFLNFDSPSITIGETFLEISESLTLDEFALLREKLLQLRSYLLSNNLHLNYWLRTHSHLGISSSHQNSKSQSAQLLEPIYASKLLPREKKSFVVDLNHSYGPYLCSIDNPPRVLLDGAAQLATHSIGFNRGARKALALKPHYNQNNHSPRKALDLVLKEKTPYKNIEYFNSGAEAFEAALLSLKKIYPTKNKILAFEGGFHGKTLLASLCTHHGDLKLDFQSPDFDVQFFPFPKQDNPLDPAEEPSAWLLAWKDPDSNLSLIEDFKVQADKLLSHEIEILWSLHQALKDTQVLAVTIEPFQAAGGDRYASPRFFRALRALTTKHNTKVIFDEAQAGLGLGGSFLWQDSLDMEAPADILVLGKKLQSGAVLSLDLDLIPSTETSAASLHRGYLQIQELLERNPESLYQRVKHYLDVFKKLLGNSFIQSTRQRAYLFSMDLKDPAMLCQVLEERLSHGLMFYPAGQKTIRFRLNADANEFEVTQIFHQLYRIFLKVAKNNNIHIPPEEVWVSNIDAHSQELLNDLEIVKRHSIIEESWLQLNLEQLSKKSPEKWDRLFYKLVTEVPELIYSEWNKFFPIRKTSYTPQEIWDFFNTEDRFGYLDLLWQGSRHLGCSMRLLDKENFSTLHEKIDALEKKVYEAERITPASEFLEGLEEVWSIGLFALDKNQELIGVCAATSMKKYAETPMVSSDPHFEDPKALYSFDLTLDPSFQGRGLGIRFKAEQIIAAWTRGCSYLSSRNRYPEAKAMARLNTRLGSLVTNKNSKDYGGEGTALFQSIELPKTGFHLADPKIPLIKNKITLSNFVSPSFVFDIQFLADFFPTPYRHFILSSGESDCVDRILQSLRTHRSKAFMTLSIQGDSFGHSTAAAQALGKKSASHFFQWPVFSNPQEMRDWLLTNNPTQCLALFISPLSNGSRKSEDEIKIWISIAKEFEVPVIFGEKESSFWKYSSNSFFATELFEHVDGLIFYNSLQVGISALREQYFCETPCKLMSTWDGDEWSLYLLKELILKESQRRKNASFSY